MSRHPMPDDPAWVALAEHQLETALAFRETYENRSATSDTEAEKWEQNENEIRRLLEDLGR